MGYRTIVTPDGAGPLYESVRELGDSIADTFLIPGALISDLAVLTNGTNWAVAEVELRPLFGPIYDFTIRANPTSTRTVPVDGDMTNEVVCTLNAEYRPPYNQRLASAWTGPLAVGRLDNTGAVSITAIAPGTALTTSKRIELGGLIYLPHMPS